MGVAWFAVACARVFLQVLLVAMMARAVTSWFVADDGQNRLMNFLVFITEPVILPARALCERFGWFRNLPLDMPFYLSSLLLMILSVILSNLR